MVALNQHLVMDDSDKTRRFINGPKVLVDAVKSQLHNAGAAALNNVIAVDRMPRRITNEVTLSPIDHELTHPASPVRGSCCAN